MENKTELIATVKSPARSVHLRKGNGFSLKEIIESGRKINQLHKLGIKIDHLRKSANPENIEVLKNLKIIKKAGTKKKPFVKKERKRTSFKLKEEKPKEIHKKVAEKTPIKLTTKKGVKSTKKEKVKPTKAEKIKVEEICTALDKLSGLGSTTAKKFIDLGVKDVETLCKENPEELAPLIKGVSVDRLKKWIVEGKELISK
ncbi:MAG: ribosomal protein L13e [Promethearchaeota archaeon]|jgi:hypothetical protein